MANCNLDAQKILKTVSLLQKRIEERFAGSSLSMVCRDLAAIAENSNETVANIHKNRPGYRFAVFAFALPWSALLCLSLLCPSPLLCSFLLRPCPGLPWSALLCPLRSALLSPLRCFALLRAYPDVICSALLCSALGQMANCQTANC